MIDRCVDTMCALFSTRFIPSISNNISAARSISLLSLSVGLLFLTACAFTPAPASSTVPQVEAFGGVIAELDRYVLPIPTPTVEPELTVIVDTGGARANIRSGPDTTFPIIGKGNNGEAYEVIATSEDNSWWQICCITIGADGLPFVAADDEDATGWVADSVVRPAGEAEGISISRPIFQGDLTAEWDVDWACSSERCEVKQCGATVQASVNRATEQQLLPVEHQVAWDDTCFDSDSWVFEVNQFTGRERTGEYEDNFLYSYWLGREPGEANGVYRLPNDNAVAVYCSGPHEVEIEEGAGWTSVYEGNTCHDVRTGMLVYLTYNKRWLFTGEFEGETYERAYFGDFETLEQKLVESNAELLFVTPR